MLIKGYYNDSLYSEDGSCLFNSGWQNNTIVPDYGKLLAALMKKDFHSTGETGAGELAGIEFIAFGDKDEPFIDFRTRIHSYFTAINDAADSTYSYDPVTEKVNTFYPHSQGTSPPSWVWVKKISPAKINYLEESGTGDSTTPNYPTSKLLINITVEELEPADKTFEFREFGIFSIPYDKQAKLFDLNKLFFINHVRHGVITKVESMTLNRKIKLVFPVDTGA